MTTTIDVRPAAGTLDRPAQDTGDRPDQLLWVTGFPLSRPESDEHLSLDICTLWHTLACDCSRPPSRLERWCAGRLARRRRHDPGRRVLPDLR